MKLWDEGPAETNRIVREHLDYVAGEGKKPWDALVALEGVVLSREPVDWQFVERQYREAFRGLPKPKAEGRVA